MAKNKKLEDKIEEANRLKKEAEEELLEKLADDPRHDEDVILDLPKSVELGEMTVEFKEWSFAQYAQIGTVVESMLKALENAGINPMLLFFRPATHLYETQILPRIQKGDLTDPDIIEVFEQDLEKEAVDITRMFAIIAPYAFKIVQFTGSLTDEEMESLSPDDGMGLFNLIMLQNFALLGKSYELFGKHL